MAADQYRRPAFEAQRRAVEATEPSVKAGFELLAREWLALAEQVEWLDQRYSPILSAEADSSRSEPDIQQQQQAQPKKDDDA